MNAQREEVAALEAVVEDMEAVEDMEEAVVVAAATSINYISKPLTK